MAASRRRGVANAPKPPTQRVNLQVTTSAYQRLLLHSIMGKEQPGAIVSRLIEEHCRAWKVAPNTSAKVMSSESEESSAHVEESAAA